MVVKDSTLRSYIKKINWGKHQEMPFSQGWAINEVIKEYRIPAKEWGWYMDLIGIQTNKQYILWRDQGTHLSFLGLLNKEAKQ